MHLALLTPEWHPGEGGGIATYVRTLARYAHQAGHQVTVVTATATMACRHERDVAGAWVISMPTLGLAVGEVAGMFRDELKRLIDRGQRPDIVEAAEFGGVAAMTGDLAGAPPLATRLHTPLALLLERNEGERIYRDDAERCQLEHRQVSRSTVVTSPSGWLAGEVHRLWRLPTVPLVIPNPVELLPTVPSRVRPPGPVRLLYLGRLEYRKGVLTLAAAAHRWFARGAKAELTFVGGDTKWRGTPMSVRMREVLGQFALPPTCRFLGSLGREEVVGQIRAADLIVLPSLYENFPYACLEAMAEAKPVLATHGSGFDEIIESGRTGYLVKPGDVESLAAALAAAENDDQLVEIGKQARLAVTRLAPERAAAELCDLYAGTAREPNGASRHSGVPGYARMMGRGGPRSHLVPNMVKDL